MPELVDKSQPDGNVGARAMRRGDSVTLVCLPLLQRARSIRSDVVAAKRGNVAGFVAVFQQQRAQRVLRRQRLGEDYGFAGAQPLRSPILDESECLDQSSRFTAVPK